MKNLFDAATAHEIQDRLAKLQPQSERLWGKMTPDQMLAHCARSMQWVLDEVVPDTGPLPVRLLGKLIKPFVFRNDNPIRKNAPTAKTLVMTDARDLNEERARLSKLIDRFVAGGPQACTKNAHPFFGKLTPEEWAILGYKHLDHHLRQFGV